jgi:two-component system response regulator HydG
MHKRILLVEDDTNTRTAMHALLELEGFTVDACGDGRQAVARLRERSYDDLITEVRLPALDGVELTRTARALQPDIRCIVVTASLRTPDCAPEISAWLFKPIDFDGLLITLRG